MSNKSNKNFQNKKLIIFDLDGTLTESKATMSSKTSLLLNKLLEKKSVAVIGGGKYEQFQKQFLDKLRAPKPLLQNLYLFPTTSTLFYRFTGGKWQLVYSDYLTPKQKKKIMKAFKIALKKHNYQRPQKPYGKIIEDRSTQITFSAIGQQAPSSPKDYIIYLEAKKKWNKESDIRPQVMKTMKKYLPEFEVRQAGLTSIDVTKKGVDKAYGVRQIKKSLGVPIKNMLFVGDAIYPGGNDYEVIKTGIDYVKVDGPEEMSKIIKKCFDNKTKNDS